MSEPSRERKLGRQLDARYARTLIDLIEPLLKELS